MIAFIDMRMRYCIFLVCAQLAFVACSARLSGARCDFRTGDGYSEMPPRDGFSKVIMDAKETDGYVRQSVRILCNPCICPIIEWEIRNVSKESVEVFAINRPQYLLNSSSLALSTYFEVEDSQGNKVEFRSWHNYLGDISMRVSDGRCYSKEGRDAFFIPLKPGESYVFKTDLSIDYQFEPGEYRVRFTGPFSRKWYTEWAYFKVVESDGGE